LKFWAAWRSWFALLPVQVARWGTESLRGCATAAVPLRSEPRQQALLITRVLPGACWPFSKWPIFMPRFCFSSRAGNCAAPVSAHRPTPPPPLELRTLGLSYAVLLIENQAGALRWVFFFVLVAGGSASGRTAPYFRPLFGGVVGVLWSSSFFRNRSASLKDSQPFSPVHAGFDSCRTILETRPDVILACGHNPGFRRGGEMPNFYDELAPRLAPGEENRGHYNALCFDMIIHPISPGFSRYHGEGSWNDRELALAFFSAYFRACCILPRSMFQKLAGS